MNKAARWRGAAILSGTWTLLACDGGAVGPFCAAAEPTTQPEVRSCVQRTSHDLMDEPYPSPRWDILFVIDNSETMLAKQVEVARQIPGLMRALEARSADYHLGFVSTDVGSLPMGEVPFPIDPADACATEKGDDGRLQAMPCGQRPGQSDAARTACLQDLNALCASAGLAPRDGEPFISVDSGQGVSNIAPRLIDGRDQGPELAAQCMALMGSRGCQLTSPLEAARRALDGHLAENRGFLRVDSQLVVIFVTDKDDCSVQASHRSENTPQTIRQFQAGGVTYPCDTQADVEIPFSCYSRQYRCLARSLECDEPMNTAGAKHNCHARSMSFLQPVDQYAKFLAQLRPNGKLSVIGLWPLDGSSADPRTLLSQVVVTGSSTGASDPAHLMAATEAGAACYAPAVQTTDGRAFSGQAQLRLSTFLGLFRPQSVAEGSICDLTSYAQTLHTAEETLVRGFEFYACLSLRPTQIPQPEPAQGIQTRSDCQVGFVDATTPGAVPDVLLPQCSDRCCDAWAHAQVPTRMQPSIRAACSGEATDCFCAQPTPDRCNGTALASVWRRGGRPFPAGTEASFRCAGVAPPTVR